MANLLTRTFLYNSRFLNCYIGQNKQRSVPYSEDGNRKFRSRSLRPDNLKRRNAARKAVRDKGIPQDTTDEIADLQDVREPRTNQLKAELDSMYLGATPNRNIFLSDQQLQEREGTFKSERESKANNSIDGGLPTYNRNKGIESRSVLLFPGQGSQFVGMGKKLLEYPGVQDLYDSASAILGFDLLKVCLEGPKSLLDKTIYCQPAVVVTSLAALVKLYADNEQLAENCICAAGFSVGEISALIHSGALSFKDGIEIVKARAEAMQELCNEEASGMMTVVQNHNSKLKLAMEMAREYCSKHLGIEVPVCSVANYLASSVKVIAGHEPALQFIETNYNDFGIVRVKRLPVSGAFHTKLMFPATETMRRVLNNSDIKQLSIPVISNVHAAPYRSDVASIKRALIDQIWSPVKWEQSMLQTYQQNTKDKFYPQTIEVGPGKQLGLLLRQINRGAFMNYHSIGV